MIEFFRPYAGELITLVVGGIIGWYPNRKKTAIDNQQSIIDLYQESLTDLKERYKEKYDDMRQDFDTKIQVVSIELEELKKSLDDWKKRYFNLKQDFDKYKKDHP